MGNIESRITAGPITNIIPSNLVERVGYVTISEIVKEEEDGWLHYIELAGDSSDDTYTINEDRGYETNERVFIEVIEINKGLNDADDEIGELYIANFQFSIDGDQHRLCDENGVWYHMGNGDLYRLKESPIEETIIRPRINLSSPVSRN